MRPSRAAAFGLLVSSAVAAQLHADNWPGWRGPTGQGRTTEANLPTTWSPTENVKWKVPLPEAGNSTPVVWGDRIFLTQATDGGKKRSLWCLNRADGAKLWERTVPFATPGLIHATNTHCAASPATDGERVVVAHGSAGVYCYDFSGKELWHRDLGPNRHYWGSAASPVIHGDTVFLNWGPGVKSFLVALDKADGSERWRAEERSGGEKDAHGSWSTPVVATVKGRPELVMSWPGELKGHDPATGKVIWSSRGLEKDGAKDRLTYTSPLVSDEAVIGMAGFGGSAVAVKAGGTGDVTDSHRLWRHGNRNPQRIGSGVIIGDHAYVVNEPSVACLDLKTGKELWSERVPGNAWSSIVQSGDGKLYVISQTGETLVFAAKPAFELIARNKLNETTRASVVPAGGELLIRTYKHLWCIADAKK